MDDNATAAEGTVAEQTLQEYTQCSHEKFGRRVADGVIRGVKLLGLLSRNGRRYEPAALRSALSLYEGAKVNVNHPLGAGVAPRDYRDRFGAIRNVRYEPDRGLFGDLHFNPKHPLAEQLAWDAANAPENVGLSHNVVARVRRDGTESVVETITRVQSVDVVADPATTRSLFESDAPRSTVSTESGAQATQDELEQLVQENTELKGELDREREEQRREARQRLIERQLKDHGLDREDAVVLSEAFTAFLERVPDEDVAPLIEDRASLVRWAAKRRRPVSRERGHAPGAKGRAAGVADFVAALTRAA